MTMKLILVPLTSLAVIGVAALLTTSAPAPTKFEECGLTKLEPAPVIERHFAKPPPPPAPAPQAPHAVPVA